MDLVDKWRAHKPQTRKYTWHGPGLKQSRLDYFLVSTDFETFIKDVDTDVKYRSDHSPVYLVLKFHNQIRGKCTCKFNNSLLHDKDYIQEVKNCITETIDQYSVNLSSGEQE